MSKPNFVICKNCVMDTSDPKIQFDSFGVCDHCNNFVKNVLPNWNTGIEGRRTLENLINRIRQENKNNEFDCIIGMSGGADSSYMLHLVVREFGLRPLVFHVDGGWNTQIAVNNIDVMVNKLDLDLYTEVIDWEEMKAFQLAYIKSGLPNIDIPQDHAFIAVLYNFASKYKIKYILNGGNFSTECVRNPLDWLYYGTDMAQINDVIKRFCPIKLHNYPFSGILRHKIYLRYIKNIKVIKPLNYVPYIKVDAMKYLEEEYGWQPYPQKHFESRFTRFYEGYWLPKRFGYDTRKVQYSSLILTKQMSREEALEKLRQDALSDDEVRNEIEFVANKLDISVQELQHYFTIPKKTHKDYRNSEKIFKIGASIMSIIGIERAIKR